MSFGGASGHLVTVTSQAEQQFINEQFPPFTVIAWIGGVQAPDPTPGTGADQGWSWITGKPWQFTAWSTSNSPAEPTDGIGLPSPEDNAENYLSVYPAFQNHGWNDVSGLTVPSSVSGYLVEFPVVVPEPTAAALSLTVGGLTLLRRIPRTRGTRR